MSILVDYISSWWIIPLTHPETTGVDELKYTIPIAPPLDIKKDTYISDGNVYLISDSELLSVKLKPANDIIPSPARNMPHITKIQLTMLNQAHLEAILSVKLKPVKNTTKIKSYLPRHPVLRELLSTRIMV